MTQDTTTPEEATTPIDETPPTTHSNEHEELLQRIQLLEKQLGESQEITKRAQSDYLRLKWDMDALIERTQTANAQLKDDTFVIVAQKVLPGILQLEQTLQHIPAELTESSLAEGIRMSYQKIMQELASVGIQEHTPQIGGELDLMCEIPLGTQPIDDDALKNKICAVAQNGFLYTKTDPHKVILPAKVFVGE